MTILYNGSKDELRLTVANEDIVLQIYGPDKYTLSKNTEYKKI